MKYVNRLLHAIGECMMTNIKVSWNVEGDQELGVWSGGVGGSMFMCVHTEDRYQISWNSI